MDVTTGLSRSTGEATGTGAERWISHRAQLEAERRTLGRRPPGPALATHGCPSCGTARMIASPAPLGTCDPK